MSHSYLSPLFNIKNSDEDIIYLLRTCLLIERVLITALGLKSFMTFSNQSIFASYFSLAPNLIIQMP